MPHSNLKFSAFQCSLYDNLFKWCIYLMYLQPYTELLVTIYKWRSTGKRCYLLREFAGMATNYPEISRFYSHKIPAISCFYSHKISRNFPENPAIILTTFLHFPAKFPQFPATIPTKFLKILANIPQKLRAFRGSTFSLWNVTFILSFYRTISASVSQWFL